MEWIGCIRSEKSRRDFVARIFALIAPVHTVLHRVSCSYETITNAPKHYETYETITNAPKHYAMNQNMSLRSNGADWVRSLRKIPM